MFEKVKGVNVDQYYKKLLESEEILPDSQQAAVIDQLQIIQGQLLANQTTAGFLARITRGKAKQVQGLYLWGDVGVGKTFLMDCFFHSLPVKKKLRVHFHEFMRTTHAQLRKLQGNQDPLQIAAKDIAANAQVICFDELVVTDIADAMLITKLLQALYNEKICMLFTSNTAPDNLYLRGLQREQFLPAIAAIKNNSVVIQMSHSDYRLRHHEKNQFYFTPFNAESEQKLQQRFDELTHHASWDSENIWVFDRPIPVKRKKAGFVWFNFFDICGVPRNQFDYLELVKKYHTIFISGVAAIPPENNDLVRSLINLIDVLYDNKVRLFLSAEKPLHQLYESGRMLFEFARTRSRLIEMQSSSWQVMCQEAHNLPTLVGTS